MELNRGGIRQKQRYEAVKRCKRKSFVCSNQINTLYLVNFFEKVLIFQRIEHLSVWSRFLIDNYYNL